MRKGLANSNSGYILPAGLIIIGVIGYLCSILLINGSTRLIFQWICTIAILGGIIFIILNNWDLFWGPE
jgi:membrane-bound ClpP family serine protease